MTIKAGHLVTSLYNHDIILVLFYWTIKHNYKKTIFSHLVERLERIKMVKGWALCNGVLIDWQKFIELEND